MEKSNEESAAGMPQVVVSGVGDISGRGSFPIKKILHLAILSVSAAMVCALVFATPSAAAETSSWKWSSKNPKPIWWDWGDSYSKEKPVRGGVFRTASPRYIGLMNPNHWPVNDYVAISYMYEFLIYHDGEFRPKLNYLAESWEYTSPTSAVMKLRKGVTFHDGSDFTAETLKYQLDWIKDRKNGAWTRGWVQPITSVSVVDDHTIKFEFAEPWAAFAGTLGMIPGYAISMKALKADTVLVEMGKLEKKAINARKKIAKLEAKAQKQSGSKAAKSLKKAAKERKKLTRVEKKLEKYKRQTTGTVPLDKHAVGTGRFMMEKASPGNYLKLKRNPNWWFGGSIGKPEMPYFDGVLITVIPDPSVRLANFRAAKLDSVTIMRAQYDLVKRDPTAKVFTSLTNEWYGYKFNHAEGPAKDIRVRKAVSHAIDRKALIAGTQFGLAVEASCMYPVNHWAHNPNLKPVKYDPELSKKLLAEAGYSEGLVLTGYTSSLAEKKTVASAIQNMLKKVGIDWRYDPLDPTAIDDRKKNREFDLADAGWGGILDPDLMVTNIYHPDGAWNLGRTHNTKAIPLIEEARTILDRKKRRQVYWQIEKAFYDNYEDVWLWYPKNMAVFRKPVMGWNQEYYLDGLYAQWITHCHWFKDGRP
ncbi:MAG: ABC transporter substrate-binding protein [Proteobacteria bacterium]|nr:ABC transporter substrate-binding protein [Pseudomonadota bacterium]